jgi:hypothetical protein
VKTRTAARRPEMWVANEAEVQARMRDRSREAAARRLAAGARSARDRHRRRLREAAGFGLVRTGLWLLDARRA